ncbi:MAG: xanthine dehydrogenase family protein molybdopterin-binding subunit [Thermodesulfobacteriota bacterium]
MELKVVGKEKKRYEGLDHVTGATRYVDDIFVPGTQVVKVLRSPVHKGKIIRLDTTKAAKLPGVAGIITAPDVPCNTYGYLTLDQPVLAETDVRYKGEPIAAVAAQTVDIAVEAVELIELEIEEQTPVFDVFEAMKPDAPKVRPEGNILQIGDKLCRRIVFGDIEKGFAEADEIVESDYLFHSQEHAAIEPQVSLAVPESDGRLTVYSVTQGLYFLLRQMQRILGQGDDVSDRWSGRMQYSFRGKLDYCDLKFVGGTVGGAFGGKTELHADHVTALLALKTGKPCKWRWTREEETLYSTRHCPWLMTFKDGVKKDGRIVARQVKSIHDAGAHTGLSSYVVDKHCFYLAGPYHIPNVLVEGYVVYTNRTPTGAIRGFGLTPGTYATEVQINKIAERIGMDPWEIRFVNALRNGDQLATRRKLDSVYMIETMQALAKWAGVTLPEHCARATSDPREV